MSTALIDAGAVDGNVSYRRSLSQLLNGAHLTVVQSSPPPSPFYVGDSIPIIYAVGNYIDAFSYRLEVDSGSGPPMNHSLNDFRTVGVLQGRRWMNDRQWPYDVQTNALGGVVWCRFKSAGVFPVIFVISGRMVQNEDEESFSVQATVTVSRRPTLQVHVVRQNINYITNT